jgi:hypothetical protein
MLRIFEGETMAVDSFGATRKVDRRAGRTIHFGGGRCADPLGVWSVEDGPALLAGIRARVAAVRHKRGCGCYLFISPTHEVFVVSEESPIGLDWCRDRVTWLVALYCPGKVEVKPAPGCLGPVVDFDLSGLEGDIAEHLGELAGRPAPVVEAPVIAPAPAPREVPPEARRDYASRMRLEGQTNWVIEGFGYRRVGVVMRAAKERGYTGSQHTLYLRLKAGDTTWERLLRPCRSGPHKEPVE